MKPLFPTREELMAMDIKNLRRLEIETPEQEILVQDVLDERTFVAPVETGIKRDDAIAANITTPEEEAKWQAVIDERVEEKKKQLFGEERVLDAKIKKLEVEKEEIEAEIKSEEAPVETQIETTVENPEPVKPPFCDSCDSKGVRHKRECPKK